MTEIPIKLASSLEPLDPSLIENMKKFPKMIHGFHSQLLMLPIMAHVSNRLSLKVRDPDTYYLLKNNIKELIETLKTALPEMEEELKSMK